MANNLPNLPDLNNSSGSSSGSSPTTSSSSDAQSTSQSASSTTSGTSSSESDSSSTSSSASSTTINGSVISGAPSLSTGGPLQLPSGLPTLSGYYSYPAPTVPPTSNAPYMQASALPQNFVFIVVGACLAFIALIILIWRFLTAWSINRNFRRDTSAAAYAPLTDMKKKPVKTESSHDLSDLSAKLPSSFNSVPNLFFSPTAEAARQSMIRPASQHMPAGHYRDASR